MAGRKATATSSRPCLLVAMPVTMMMVMMVFPPLSLFLMTRTRVGNIINLKLKTKNDITSTFEQHYV